MVGKKLGYGGLNLPLLSGLTPQEGQGRQSGGVLGLQVTLFPLHFLSLSQQEPQHSVRDGSGLPPPPHFSNLRWVKGTHPIPYTVTPGSQD